MGRLDTRRYLGERRSVPSSVFECVTLTTSVSLCERIYFTRLPKNDVVCVCENAALTSLFVRPGSGHRKRWATEKITFILSRL